jgi:dTDP-4-dehydrorhamnose reductase
MILIFLCWMQTILITGSNGFIASNLIEIAANDYKIIATARGSNRSHYTHDNIIFEQLDFTSEEDIRRVFEKHKPDIIVHAGAMSKPDKCENNKSLAFETNVLSTEYLIKAAESFKSFFILLSTDFIFDGEKGMYKEDDKPGPVNYYGETKMLAETIVRTYVNDWSIVRTVLVYGNTKSGRNNILTMVANALKNNEEIKIFDDQVRTPTYVEDIAKGIKLIIDKKAKGIYHISGKDILTPYQMAVAVAQYLGLNKNLIKKATEADFQQPARRPLKTGFNISKAEAELNYKTTSFKDGLGKTFSYIPEVN